MAIPYTVQAGDTLTAIATICLGDAKRFTEIRNEHMQVLKDKLTINILIYERLRYILNRVGYWTYRGIATV